MRRWCGFDAFASADRFFFFPPFALVLPGVFPAVGGSGAPLPSAVLAPAFAFALVPVPVPAPVRGVVEDGLERSVRFARGPVVFSAAAACFAASAALAA